jgi:hypothetical protein
VAAGLAVPLSRVRALWLTDTTGTDGEVRRPRQRGESCPRSSPKKCLLAPRWPRWRWLPLPSLILYLVTSSHCYVPLFLLACACSRIEARALLSRPLQPVIMLATKPTTRRIGTIARCSDEARPEDGSASRPFSVDDDGDGQEQGQGGGTNRNSNASHRPAPSRGAASAGGTTAGTKDAGASVPCDDKKMSSTDAAAMASASPASIPAKSGAVSEPSVLTTSDKARCGPTDGKLAGVDVHQWKAKLTELTAFKKRHGNCNVPAQYEANPSLGTCRHPWLMP